MPVTHGVTGSSPVRTAEEFQEIGALFVYWHLSRIGHADQRVKYNPMESRKRSIGLYCIGRIKGYLLRIFFPFLMTMPLVSSFTLTPARLYVMLSPVSADVSATFDKLVVAVAILYKPYFDDW